MLQEGKYYSAKLLDAGIQENKNSGNPEPFMKFEIEEDGTKHNLFWTGYLKSEDSQRIAAETLVKAGFVGSDLKDLQTGVHAGTFAPVTIRVKLEAYRKDGVPTGKFRIKAVYQANEKSSKFAGVTPNMASLFTTAKASMGTKKPAAAAKKEEAPF